MREIKNTLRLIDIKFRRCFWLLVIVTIAYSIISALIFTIYPLSSKYFSDNTFVGDKAFESIAMMEYGTHHWLLVLGMSLFFVVFLAERSDIKFVVTLGVTRIYNAIGNIGVAIAVSITYALGIIVSSLINIAVMRLSGGYWITPFMSGMIVKDILLSLLLNMMSVLVFIIFGYLIVSIYKRSKYVAVGIVLLIVSFTVAISLGFIDIPWWNKVWTVIVSKEWGGLILFCLSAFMSLCYAVIERFSEVRI